MYNKDIDFVARNYRRGLFDANRAWKAFGFRRARLLLRRWQVAASVAVLITAGAIAAVVMVTRPNVKQAPQPAIQPTTSATVHEPAAQAPTSIAIDFDDAPLTEVVTRIESLYGVNVKNVPADASELRLTLHFEGNAADLIDTINVLLDTEMTVQSK